MAHLPTCSFAVMDSPGLVLAVDFLRQLIPSERQRGRGEGSDPRGDLWNGHRSLNPVCSGSLHAGAWA